MSDASKTASRSRAFAKRINEGFAQTKPTARKPKRRRSQKLGGSQVQTKGATNPRNFTKGQAKKINDGFAQTKPSPRKPARKAKKRQK